MTATVTAIQCYPIKGLGGFSLSRAALTARGIANDRAFGITVENTDLWHQAAATARPSWRYYLNLKQRDDLVRLHCSLSSNSNLGNGGDDLCLHIVDTARGRESSGRPADDDERRRLESFLGDALSLPGARLEHSARPLWDTATTGISLLNDNSVAALADCAGVAIAAARFRANIVFSGLPAWREERLSGIARIGQAALKITGRIPRCPATIVNPQTAQQDLNIPKLLSRHRGFADMGLAAEVVAAGEIATGMEIDFEPA